MPFDFYFAGSQSKETTELMASIGANVLRSYINDRKSIAELIEKKRNGEWRGKLLIDSGAFTVHRKGGTIDVDAYIDFLNANKDYIDYAIQFDDIPGVWGEVKTIEQIQSSPVKTWENYVYMTSKLERPKMLLPVLHQGENLKHLQTMLDYRFPDGTQIPYICISGNKELAAKQRKQWYTRVFDVIVRSSNPNVKTHCLGSATITDMEEFPFTSSDATSWLLTSATGSILTPFGPVLMSEQQKYDKSHIVNLPEACQETIRSMCTEYNIDFNELLTDYKQRSNFNVMYLFNTSKKTTFNKRNLKLGGALF